MIGDTLRKYRKEKGLNLKKVGELVGFAENTVSQWERGIRQPDVVTLNKLSDILGIPLEKLFDTSKKLTKISLDINGVNEKILTLDEEDAGWIVSKEKILLSEEKIMNWKDKIETGSIIVGALGCRYLVTVTETKPHPIVKYGLIPTYGFINIDHANWELCEPRFESTDDLVEWFASIEENPIIDIYSSIQVEQQLPGNEYV